MRRRGPGLLDNARPVGPLRAGTYVIEIEDGNELDVRAAHDMLVGAAPEGVRFIVLGRRMRMVPTEPESEDRIAL